MIEFYTMVFLLAAGTSTVVCGLLSAADPMSLRAKVAFIVSTTIGLFIILLAIIKGE